MSDNLLIIAGLDPSGGAGLLADVRTAAALGARPVGVVTALTEQDTRGVRAANPVSAEVLQAQLTTLLTDVELAAVKIGMLGNEELARVIGEALALTNAPVVWDPVGRASGGGVPLYYGSWERALSALVGHLTVMTPNLAELFALVEAGADAEPRACALELARRARCTVVVTGGHGDDPLEVRDLVVGADGALTELAHPRLPGGTEVHGTGCALSTALAAELAAGTGLLEAVRRAQGFVARAIASAAAPGRGVTSIW